MAHAIVYREFESSYRWKAMYNDGHEEVSADAYDTETAAYDEACRALPFLTIILQEKDQP